MTPPVPDGGPTIAGHHVSWSVIGVVLGALGLWLALRSRHAASATVAAVAPGQGVTAGYSAAQGDLSGVQQSLATLQGQYQDLSAAFLNAQQNQPTPQPPPAPAPVAPPPPVNPPQPAAPQGTTADLIANAYQSFLGRAPESAQVVSWHEANAGKVGLGADLASIASVGTLGNLPQFVTAEYSDILGRAPDSAQALAWHVANIQQHGVAADVAGFQHAPGAR